MTDEKKIEEVLTRLLEGPVGDGLCSKIVAQIGRDMDKVMEPFVTKAQLDAKQKQADEAAEKAAKDFHEGMEEGAEGMAGFFAEISSHPIRLHNLEVMRAVDHYRPFDPKEHLDLEMALMSRIRERVLDDLKSWSGHKEIDPEPKAMMLRILAYLEPDNSERGPLN